MASAHKSRLNFIHFPACGGGGAERSRGSSSSSSIVVACLPPSPFRCIIKSKTQTQGDGFWIRGEKESERASKRATPESGRLVRCMSQAAGRLCNCLPRPPNSMLDKDDEPDRRTDRQSRSDGQTDGQSSHSAGPSNKMETATNDTRIILLSSLLFDGFPAITELQAELQQNLPLDLAVACCIIQLKACGIGNSSSSSSAAFLPF